MGRRDWRSFLEGGPPARALHDPLTGAPSLELLTDRIEQALARAERDASMVAVMLVHLDGIRHVDVRHGHRAADHLLAQVAARIATLLRPHDTVARSDSDELVVVCQDADEQIAAGVAERIRRSLRRPFDVAGEQVAVRASIGIALASSGVGDADALRRDADVAMRRAHHAGGDACRLFDEVLQRERDDQRRLAAQLVEASQRDELELLYQPIIALGRDSTVPAHGDVVVGVEALLRWRSGQRLIPPGAFLPAAEAQGLTAVVGGWVLREACRQLASWQRALPAEPPFTLFVNLSDRYVRDATLLDAVVGSLTETGANPRGLLFDVTEDALGDDGRRGSAVLRQLTALGVRLALDDFGAGQGSLACVRRSPVEVVKIHRGVVHGVEHRTVDRGIVAAVTGMAGELGMAALAEGVETAAQLAAVRDLGCDLAQGNYMGRPAPASEIDRLLGIRHDPSVPGR